MTDKGIVKALECHTSQECVDCPYDKGLLEPCIGQVMKDALNLINRQQAEIEKLKSDVAALPVKYGQTLWRIDGNGFRPPEFQKAVPVTVQEIVFKDVRGKPQWSFIASSTMFSFGGIGKTVFLTKEEAEKVIAKRRANNG